MCASTTAAAIVAGGAARRFSGRDKGRLVIEGRSIIVRQVEILQRVAREVLVIAPDPARYTDLPVRVLPDVIAGIGALGGVLTALEGATADRVIVVAGDMPFLTAELFGRLCELATGRDGAWVRTPRGVEPLVACYATRASAAIRAHVEAGARRAMSLADVLDMAVLSSPELDTFGPPERLLANINTPDDYARVQYGSA